MASSRATATLAAADPRAKEAAWASSPLCTADRHAEGSAKSYMEGTNTSTSTRIEL